MALTPALQPIDGVAVSYIDAAVALGNTINEMDKYYTQENYKDDAFAKGKTFHYYSLAVMISAKQINNLISQDKFDAEAAMKKVSELETLVAQAKEADKSGMNFSFINSAGQYQLEAKKYVRRIRDKVLHSDWDKRATSGRKLKLDGRRLISTRALRDYNEMVDEILQLIVIAGRVCDEHGYVTKS